MIALAMVMVLLAVTGGAAVLGAVVIARHHAQSAADLGALAAATGLASGSQIACARALSVASAMRVSVIGCDVHGLDVVLTVSADAGVRGFRATARARAGPDESAG